MKKNDNHSLDGIQPSEIEEKKPTCFVIMPIADTPGYENRHFDRVYSHIIKPACEKANFRPIRADEITNTNFIVLDILRRIVECDIAICDLSSRNPNVMYELGLRQAFNKKTVLIKDNITTNPFDVQGFRYCEYDNSLRIDCAHNNVIAIAKALTATHSASSEEVNSIVQLLRIEPAQIGERTQLSDQNTVILDAIKELATKLNRQTPSAFEIHNQSELKDESTAIGDSFNYQFSNYKIQKLIGNVYDLNDKEFGIYQGIKKNPKGIDCHAFTYKKTTKYIEPNSDILGQLVESFPF